MATKTEQLDFESPFDEGSLDFNFILVSQLAELLGGKVGYRPSPMGGSVFWVSFPFEKMERKVDLLPSALSDQHAKAESSITECEKVNLPPIIAPKRKLLIVDDEKINRKIFVMQAEKLGFECDEAKDGIDVLTKFEDVDPNYFLILMDIRMPRMDGIDCSVILKRKLGIKSPVVAVTADATANTVRESLAAGMERVFFKPALLKDILQKLDIEVAPLKEREGFQHYR